MTSKRTKLQEDTHFRVLRILQENPEMSQRELAEAVGVSVGGIHYVLNALIDKGLVKLGDFTAAADKRRYAYVLTPKGIVRKAAVTRAFLSRKIEEYEALQKEIEALKNELPEDGYTLGAGRQKPETTVCASTEATFFKLSTLKK
ncbi:MarR family EPS-associated transcriptional regulator [Shimia litoralis]|uniref:MarR family EPS-associated transcriptional regulator n=1 Tax=Shimia litoralis TaxID=420403 RepID=A0A4U7MWU4_9RHOB|nr:MarR family EPS-associated transcriptional regulator [Shimia litoralis]TKZ17443.1 MarR family EPS-associated transcriptional regulator [Shimia litoralis]